MCYFVSEFLYVFMFVRIIMFILHLTTFSKYQSISAVRHCEKYGVEPEPAFSAKCYLNEHPVFILIFVLIIPSIVIFGTILRIFERPAHETGSDNSLEYFQNGYWNIVITMTTVGYGDVFPITLFGRLTCCFAALWGGVILSIMFATVGAFLLLADNQKKAFSSIIVSRAASRTIVSALRHNAYDKGTNPVKQIKDWDKVRKSVVEFKKIRDEYGIDDSEERNISSIDSRLRNLEERMERFEEGMQVLLSRGN